MLTDKRRLPVTALTLVAGTAAVVRLMTQRPIDVDVTAEVVIDAPREVIWDYLSDFEGHWEQSNPDVHMGTRVTSQPKRPLRDGLTFYQKETVNGIVGEIDAKLHDVHEQQSFRWDATTTYHLFGVQYDIREGGTVRIEPTTHDEGFRVTHRVWGAFPDTLAGRLLGWWMLNGFRLREDMLTHTQDELDYFKRRIENRT